MAARSYRQLKRWNPIAAFALVWLIGTSIGLLVIVPISGITGRPLTPVFVIEYLASGAGGLLALELLWLIARQRAQRS